MMNPIPPSIDGKMNHWPGGTVTIFAAAVGVHPLPCFFLAPSASKDQQRAKGFISLRVAKHGGVKREPKILTTLSFLKGLLHRAKEKPNKSTDFSGSGKGW